MGAVRGMVKHGERQQSRRETTDLHRGSTTGRGGGCGGAGGYLGRLVDMVCRPARWDAGLGNDEWTPLNSLRRGKSRRKRRRSPIDLMHHGPQSPDSNPSAWHCAWTNPTETAPMATATAICLRPEGAP